LAQGVVQFKSLRRRRECEGTRNPSGGGVTFAPPTTKSARLVSAPLLTLRFASIVAQVALLDAMPENFGAFLRRGVGNLDHAPLIVPNADIQANAVAFITLLTRGCCATFGAIWIILSCGGIRRAHGKGDEGDAQMHESKKIHNNLLNK
jgi:hypothetical protein